MPAAGEDATDEDAAQEEATGTSEAPAFPPEPIITSEPSTPSAPRPQRKSAAAAIARFFGLGTKAETEGGATPQPIGEPAAPPPEVTVEPIATTPAPAEPVAPAPEPERKPSRKLGIARPPEERVTEVPQATFVAAHDPAPVAVEAEPVAEVAAALAEPAPEVHEVRPDDVTPTTPAVEEPEAVAPPAPNEPVAPQPIIVPEVEKSEIVATGEVAGPPKGGWWKKRAD